MSRSPDGNQLPAAGEEGDRLVGRFGGVKDSRGGGESVNGWDAAGTFRGLRLVRFGVTLWVMVEANRQRLALAGCIVVAAGVFLTGINWGLPSRAVDPYLFGARTPWR